MNVDECTEELKKFLEPIKNLPIGISTLETHVNWRLRSSNNWEASLNKIIRDEIQYYNVNQKGIQNTLETIKDWFAALAAVLTWIYNYETTVNISWELETKPLRIHVNFNIINPNTLALICSFSLWLKTTGNGIEITIVKTDNKGRSDLLVDSNIWDAAVAKAFDDIKKL